MCGIVGFLDFSGNARNENQMQDQARRMAEALTHRGPDDGGVWVDASSGAALGHRRLSVVDLSPAGHQPMISSSGRYVISFNGEIYNFEELRQELLTRGCTFRGHSDTEIMLEAFQVWGIEEALKKFSGMFAFALWDQKEKILYLGRDRMGEKPLYYGWMKGVFVFASELKALKAHTSFESQIRRDALALYMRHSCVPAPYSIYRNVYKLLPGSFIAIRAGSAKSGIFPEPVVYWSLRTAAERGVLDRFKEAETEILDHFESELKRATRWQLTADVPVGVFLSGGIDSSLVAAIAQAGSSRPVHTFTIGFFERQYNEASYAKAVAGHLKTEHTELFVKGEDALALIPHLASIYDEPFSDASQIPACLIARLARKHVTVALGGDGGDELFGGYPRFFWAERFWNLFGFIPHSLRQEMSKFSAGISGSGAETWPLVGPLFKKAQTGRRAQMFAGMIKAKGKVDFWRRMLSHWADPEEVVSQGTEALSILTRPEETPPIADYFELMMYFAQKAYLPDVILAKVDRASMASSLEVRAPFLDPRIVEFSWRLPKAMKCRAGKGKILLRKLLGRYLPESFIDRPKKGFDVPLGAWLRGPLRDWAESLLDSQRLAREGFLNPVLISRVWKDHLEGKREAQYLLWDVLMFQSWLEQNRKNG